MKITRDTKKDNEQIDVHLTKRELEIIQLIDQEKSNRQIAQALSITERTVETHRRNIFKKTKVRSIVGLIIYAYRNKLV